DRKPYVAALITVDPEVANGTDVQAAVQAAVDAVNSDRSRYEQIKRFAVLPREFTLEHDEMTPTLKLKRKVVLEHFADEVESLYDRGSTPPAERPFLRRLRRLETPQSCSAPPHHVPFKNPPARA